MELIEKTLLVINRAIIKTKNMTIRAEVGGKRSSPIFIVFQETKVINLYCKNRCITSVREREDKML